MIAFVAFLTFLAICAALGGDYPAPVRAPDSTPGGRFPNLDHRGRTLKVGVDVHAQVCFDDEGKCECICGLADAWEAELLAEEFRAEHDDGRRIDLGGAS